MIMKKNLKVYLLFSGGAGRFFSMRRAGKRMLQGARTAGAETPDK